VRVLQPSCVSVKYTAGEESQPKTKPMANALLPAGAAWETREPGVKLHPHRKV